MLLRTNIIYWQHQLVFSLLILNFTYNNKINLFSHFFFQFIYIFFSIIKNTFSLHNRSFKYIIYNNLVKINSSETLIDKVIICSSDVENVKNKIMSLKYYDFDENLKIAEKPMKIELLNRIIIEDHF